MDESNLFAFGFGNGGIMAHRLVAASPNTGAVWFKGIASCGCVMGGRRVNDIAALSSLVNPGEDLAFGPPATHNVHLLHIHGGADLTIPYDGGIADTAQPFLQVGLSADDATAFATWFEPFENTLSLLWGVVLPEKGEDPLYQDLVPGGISNAAFEDWYVDAGALASLGTWSFDSAGFGGQVTEFFQSFVGAPLGDYDVLLRCAPGDAGWATSLRVPRHCRDRRGRVGVA